MKAQARRLIKQRCHFDAYRCRSCRNDDIHLIKDVLTCMYCSGTNIQEKT